MSDATRTATKRPGKLARFARTPKGLLVFLLVGLAAIAGAGEGAALVLPGLLGAVAAAILVDLPVLRYRKGRWVFPDGAILTGLIVAMVLSPHESWHLAAITAAVAVASKYLLRAGPANIFNPAALALVITFYLFDTGQSWWGAVPELTPWAILVLMATGIYITRTVNKAPVVLTFLGTYYLLVTVTAFAGDPATVAELYRSPDLHAALFFAFFMVTDPPTSPPRPRDQLTYGVIVAIIAYAVFESVGSADFLLLGLLAANVWEAWRRWRTRLARPARVVAPAA